MTRKPRVRTYSHTLDWNAYEVPMLIAQPLVQHDDAHEGFVLKEAVAERNLELLHQMLQLASGQVPVEVDGTRRYYRAQMILLPEYALPARKIERCQEIMRALPPNSICIAGFDAMTPRVWDQWQQGAENYEDLRDVVREQPQYQWVNAAGIWIREGNKEPVYYLQPKLEGAAEERCSASMLRGRDVLRFEIQAAGHYWSLAVLICYDMIAPDVEGRPLAHGVRDQLPQTDLLVVIQHNPKPYRFYPMARDLLIGRGGSARVGTIVFANTAPEELTSNSLGYGHAGLVFLYSDWPSLASNVPLDRVPRGYRRRSPQPDITYAGFRCHRPAVHSLTYRSVLRSRTEEYITDCCVFYLDNNGLLPRTAEGHFCGPRFVSALDYHLEAALVSTEPRQYYAHVKLSGAAEQKLKRLQEAHQQLRDLFVEQQLRYQRIKEIVAALLHRREPAQLYNPDEWQSAQVEALQLLMVALDILLAGSVNLDLALEGEGANPRTVFPLPVTGQTSTCTLSIIQGDPNRDYDTILEELLDPVEKELDSLKRPHLFLLLRTMSPCSGPERLDLARLTRRALVGVDELVPLTEPAEFTPQPGETLEGEEDKNPPIYWYTYQALRYQLREALDVTDLAKRLEEAFTCLVA